MARRVLDLDFDEIEKWARARKIALPNRWLFPPVGYIIDEVAAGFLYFTDSGIAIIDSYMSNPDSDSDERDFALQAITSALIDCARLHKCKVIKCDTQLEAIKNRALGHGFKSVGFYESFIMEL